MKARTKFLIGSLLLSTSLFSGGGDDYFKVKIEEFIKQQKIELRFDEYDKRVIHKLADRTKLTREQIFEYYDYDTRKEIRKVAKYFDVPAEWFYKLYFKECRLNPYATNPITNAQGTIQFMPSTARNLGTSVEELSTMSVKEQLPYVQKYLEAINPSKKFKSFTDLYLAVFFPKAIGKNGTYVMGSHVNEEYVEKVAKQNKGIDKDKNNSITVNEFAQYANRC